MQNDYDTYGECFSVTILDKISRYEDRVKEYEWIFKLKTYDRNFGYNYKDNGALHYASIHNKKGEQ